MIETLGSSEILIILMGALFIFAPAKIPELARSLAHAMVEYQRAIKDFKMEINTAAKENPKIPLNEDMVQRTGEDEESRKTSSIS